ncbi:hypothetical protein [Kiloniella majae]|uniref:hypothetical protein n=1 Tax=Kiloniella majae TaxID=1938558 RepID=UPI000A2787D7|nr:hypothetical protein [Kiloniella majae]
MLKQPCHTLRTNGACGTSFSQDHTIFTSAPKEATTLLNRLLARTRNWFATAFEVRKERRVLADLTSEQREDVGLSKEQVHQESSRAYWDLPTDRVE